MIAEIKGKISRTGSNLNDRLEDALTGNFFGTLRYMSFNKYLKEILLQGIYPKEVTKYIEEIDKEEFSENIEFWPYDEEGELDVLLEFDNCTIGVEVKYLSGLSSYDDNVEDEKTSLNEENNKSKQQLARESRIVSKKGLNKNKILLFVAKEEMCKEVYEHTISENIMEADIHLCYISWQSIIEILKNIKADNPYEKVMTNDLKDLLIRKGFEQFKSFELDINVKEEWYSFGRVKREMISFDKDIDLGIEENWYEFK